MDIELICNTPDDVLFANVRANSSRALPWVKLVGPGEGHAVLVGGGPSLVDTFPILEKRILLGQTVFALNGAAKFLNERQIVPDYQVIADARPENAMLIGRANHYLLASQCAPCVVDAVPEKRTTLWHPGMAGIDEHTAPYEADHGSSHALIGGGVNVGLLAMCLVYAMGFRKLHLFGYDSSHRDGMGHAYRQPMNDHHPLCKVTLNGKTFTSSLTMARQAELFPELADHLIEAGCIITVDGDGLMQAVVENMKQPC
jgi:hypothetical protein